MARFGVEGIRYFNHARAAGVSTAGDLTYTFNRCNGIDQKLRSAGHTRTTIGFVIAMGLDPEQIDIVGITTIVATLVRIADIGFPAIRVGPIECARMSGRSQCLIDAVAPVERVRQIAGSANAGRACMIEIAYAFYTESCHSLLLAMPHEH